ncbi:hypothetical protein U0039_05290 [Stenotrophomonas maltophilia]|nr:hypothetical protein [Stenotrophomonas maltophilia]EKT4074938.1 hypothetical protein [Stenotrophomonas maltophilia]EKT4084021.1 hypothetical protein [Stenotrophomonas maltophilia]EKT4085977.1 hypothetical protein [Stenotrophomonas maltophilia]EKT4106812.1 hypothetical protein [Stenotrophomonas maltophilia]EKU9962594.1 hypothetical protein [Stenotrophomonas maltophilia]
MGVALLPQSAGAAGAAPLMVMPRWLPRLHSSALSWSASAWYCCATAT